MMSGMREVREVPIRDEMIRLGQLLKLAGVAEDGTHAKELIETEEVEVNGEVDTRRGRQVRPGDVVRVRAESFKVVSG